MTPLGPFGAPPRLGLAVSGGADSLTLALLAAAWASERGGSAHAFIVDHGLRHGSRAEAEGAMRSLTRLGVPAHILTLASLSPGTGLSVRARSARFAALESACHHAGIIDLLLGHHAADQAETLIMRGLRGSGPDGMAGMAAVTETAGLRLLRPLLSLPPGRLRATLTAFGIPWAEDPTNANSAFTRARLRIARADAAGTGPATLALVEAAAASGLARRRAETASARWLARHAAIRPEGFALLPDGPWPPAALAVLLRLIAGADHPPAFDAVARIAAAPQARIGGGICLGGVRLLAAGRLGPGFLLCREAAAVAPPLPAIAGAYWDRRFRRPRGLPDLPAETIGALGADASTLRDRSELPAVVLETLPAYRSKDGVLLAVPALSWPSSAAARPRALFFHPPLPAAGAAFLGSAPLLRGTCHAGSVDPA